MISFNEDSDCFYGSYFAPFCFFLQRHERREKGGKVECCRFVPRGLSSSPIRWQIKLRMRYLSSIFRQIALWSPRAYDDNSSSTREFDELSNPRSVSIALRKSFWCANTLRFVHNPRDKTAFVLIRILKAFSFGLRALKLVDTRRPKKGWNLQRNVKIGISTSWDGSWICHLHQL